ncbi:MAG TPA: rhamnogalacturonan acetylesterase [Chitinophagaceae bacterium]|nr:rhamnogalacturonan acetylesterase [Chitinophagaceae bacterium]
MGAFLRSIWFRILLIGTCSLITSFVFKEKPTLYIIGDSTVRNGDGSGRNGQWGWGSFLAGYFDSSKITIVNRAIGGRSSRTFITEGRWDSILIKLKKGDFVIMQFGHNDGGPLDDTARARGTIRGIGDESKEIYNPITKKQEVVHTYGWYMRKYLDDARRKKATAIVCSPVPRDDWQNNLVKRSDSTYAGWSRQVAQSGGAFFIDLNNKIAEQYELLGQEKVKTFFPADHTHTNREGAELNARIVSEELTKLKGKPFKQYFLITHSR